MSFDTYAALQAEVLSGLYRTSSDTAIVAAIPGFITLAEAQANRRLRVSRMVGRATATISDEYSALPSDFGGPIAFRLTDTSPITSLELVSPEEMADLKAGWNQTADTPQYYAVVGGEFEFCPVPTGSNAAALTYYKKTAALASGVTWLLTAYPDIYYHGALSYGWRFLRDDAPADREWALFLNAIGEAVEIDKKEAGGFTGFLHVGAPLAAGM